MARSLKTCWSLRGLGLLTALGLTGCATVNLEVAAPPPSATDEPLVRGRQLYVTKCAKCHSPEPVRNYTAVEWQKIMPEMADETNMAGAELAAVTAYVHWALKQPLPTTTGH